MADQLRWGIMGAGSIAGTFAGELSQTDRGELVAVGSRAAASGEKFTAQYGGAVRVGYDALLADPDVDAIYVTLPNTMHTQWSIKAMEAGKHVLCEKPFAGRVEDAQTMFDAAARTGMTLIEAFMYRTQPVIDKLLETVADGAIGQVKLIRSNFTFNRPADKNDLRYHPEMAGGSMMDVGCYCTNLSRAIVRAIGGGEPSGHQAVMHRHEHGVDDYAAGTLSWDNGVLATFTCGMTVLSDRTTFIGGEDGYIAIDSPWFSDGTFKVVTGEILAGEAKVEVVEAPSPKGKYAMEAERFADAVAGGEPWITAEDTLGNMRTLDALRTAAGLGF